MSKFKSSLSAKGTCNILRDDAWLFSPSLGLLAFNQPALLANVRCLRSESSVTSTSSTASSSSHKSFRNEPKFPLLRDIFYQREDSITNRRYGPLQPVGSRSLPLYWLRPSDIGAVVGLSVSSRNLDGKLSTTDIDKALVSFGVECNRYRGEYTGVSLERYRRLIRLLGNEYNTFTTQKHTDDKYIFSSLNGFGFAAIAWLVWEKASSKAELLEYLTALNKYSEIDMFTESAANSLGTESGRNGWIEESFIESELGLNTIQVAIERLLQSPHQQQSDKNKLQHQHELSFGQALEVVAASLSLETSVKPTLKLGRYTFTSISTDSIVPKTTPNVTVSASMKALKPDCVEVTIREILEALIYDRSTRTYKTEWLPDTTLPSVRMFFVQLNCGELSNTRVGASVTKNDNQSDVLPEHYRQNTTAGQVWFNLCSALPLCDYLSRTDTGVQYELTPTRVNVCKVLSIFLTGKSDTFHNFQTLSFYWNQHRLSQATLCGEDLSGAPLTATDEVASFRAPFSDTEMIQRETGRLSYAHSNCALLVEIEKAHGLSSVRHLRADVSKLVWQQSVVKGRILRHWQSILATSGVNKKDNCQLSIPQLIMISATLGDDMLYSAHDHCQSVLSKKLYSDETLRNIMCLTTAAVLAMPVGEERLSYVYRITQVPSSTSGTATGGAVDESAGGGGVMSSVAAERKREYDESVYALIDKLLHSLMTTAATRSSYMTEVVDMKILIQWLHSQVSELLQSSTSASTTSLVSSYMTLVWSKYRFAAITITTVSVVAAFVLIPYVWHIHD